MKHNLNSREKAMLTVCFDMYMRISARVKMSLLDVMNANVGGLRNWTVLKHTQNVFVQFERCL